MNKEEKEAIEYIKFKTITGLETLQLEKDAKAIDMVLNYIDKLQEENEILRNRIDRVLKKLDTGDYVAYTAYGDLLYEDIELIEILKGEKE